MGAAGVVEGWQALDEEIHPPPYDPHVTYEPVTLPRARHDRHEVKGLGKARRREEAGQEHVGIGQVELVAVGVLHRSQREMPSLLSRDIRACILQRRVRLAPHAPRAFQQVSKHRLRVRFSARRLTAALSTSANRPEARHRRQSLLPSCATIRRALLSEAGEGEAEMLTSESREGSKRAEKAPARRRAEERSPKDSKRAEVL